MTRQAITSNATYAPWVSDQSFRETYQAIREHTLVDEYRCYELWQLVGEAAKGRGALLEVGVWNGGTGALIAKRAQELGMNDTVYLCDTFRGVVKAGAKDSVYKGGEHADASRESVEAVLRRLNVDTAKILTGVFPDETGAFIRENEFRFCHIDVDVYESARDIVDWIWPRLTIGGLIVFDDYGFEGCDGITKFVDEERSKAGRIVIHNLNGHAVMVKVSA